MFLGKVIGNASSETNPDARDIGLKIVQKLDLYRNPCGHSAIAVNYVGANDGDIVIVGTPDSAKDHSALSVMNSSKDSTILGILKQETADPRLNASN